MSKSNVKLQLPVFRITAKDVIAYCKSRHLKPTADEAERWLSARRSQIETSMRCMIEKDLEFILDDATIDGYPDPDVNKQFLKIQSAIFEVEDRYGAAIGKKHCMSTNDDQLLLELVEKILKQPKHIKACVPYENEFGDQGEGIDNWKISHRTDRVHITLDGDSLTAELASSVNCNHGKEFFIPAQRNSAR